METACGAPLQGVIRLASDCGMAWHAWYRTTLDIVGLGVLGEGLAISNRGFEALAGWDSPDPLPGPPASGRFSGSLAFNLQETETVPPRGLDPCSMGL